MKTGRHDARPVKGKFGARLVSRVVIAHSIAVLVLILSSVSLFVPIRHLERELSQLNIANNEFLSLKVSLVNQETGQRGYDLTGNPIFLDTFNTGTANYQTEVQALSEMGRVVPRLNGPISTTLQFAQTWRAKYGIPQIQEKKNGRDVSEQSLLSGKQAMDAFLEEVNDATGLVQSIVQRDRQRLEMFTYLTMILAIILSAAVMAAVMLVVRRQIRRWLRPIEMLTHVVEEYSLGDFEHAVPDVQDATELGTLVTGVESMRKSVKEYLTLVQAQNLKDGLTGIWNRRYFDEKMKEALDSVVHGRTAHCLLMVDIDNFKQLNDTYGHLTGDEALRSVAHSLTTAVQQQGMVARYGGEEFGLILLGDKMVCAQIAERIRRRIEETPGPESVRMTISCGLTAFHETDDYPDAVVRRADKALYQAKANGRNRVESN